MDDLDHAFVDAQHLGPAERFQDALGKAQVFERAGDLAEKEFAALMKDGQRMIPPGGNAKKRLSEWSDQERAAYIEMLKRQKLQPNLPLAKMKTRHLVLSNSRS